MKKKRFYLAWVAALLMAGGCSDDIEKGGSGNGTPIDGESVYMTVNIMTPASSGSMTKAGNPNEDPTGGEEGDGSLTALEEENYVRSATIVLYTAEGDINDVDINTPGATIVTSAYTEMVLNQNAGNTDYTNHDYKATVQLNSEDLVKDTPYRVLAIVNANVASQFPKGASLADCKLEDIDHHQIGSLSERGRFIMSTHSEQMKSTASGEIEESVVTFTGEETSSDKAEEATVWVERLSARIDYTGTKFDFTVNSTEPEDNPYFRNTII